MDARLHLKKWIGEAYLGSSAGQRRLRSGGVVLMLHRVLADEHEAARPHRQTLCTGPAAFERLLAWVTERFDCVHLDELLAEPVGARPRLALTFDDGWRDNADNGLPLLERYQVPASIFLSTDLIGTSRHFWWEAIGETIWRGPSTPAGQALIQRLIELGLEVPTCLRRAGDSDGRSLALLYLLQSMKRLSPPVLLDLAACCESAGDHCCLDWDQVRLMERSGLVRFGPHGASHGILTRMSPDELAAEIQRSRDALATHCSNPLKIYCYPNGDHNLQVRDCLEQFGYRQALGTASGFVTSQSDPLNLPRIDVSHRVAATPGLLAWRLMQGARR